MFKGDLFSETKQLEFCMLFTPNYLYFYYFSRKGASAVA